MYNFEKLLDKLIKEGKIDKLELFRKLGMRSTEGDTALVHNSIQSKHNNILEEHGQNQSNDMLLDEQIMGEDESQDEDHIITDDDHVASEA